MDGPLYKIRYDYFEAELINKYIADLRKWRTPGKTDDYFRSKKSRGPPLVVSKIVTTRCGCPGDFIFLMGKSMKTRYLALEIKNKFFEFELFWRGFNFAHPLFARKKRINFRAF